MNSQMTWTNMLTVFLSVHIFLGLFYTSESKVLNHLSFMFEGENGVGDNPSTKYFISTRKENAAEAFELCSLAGYRLATIDNAAKNDLISDRMMSSDVDQLWTSGVQILDSNDFEDGQHYHFVWNSTYNEIEFKNFADPKYNDVAIVIDPIEITVDVTTTTTPHDQHSGDQTTRPPDNICDSELPVPCNTTLGECTVQPEVCTVQTEDCVLTEPVCHVSRKPCKINYECNTVTPDCTVDQAPCYETTKPQCTVQTFPCTVYNPPCQAVQNPCIVSPPNCTWVEQECSTEPPPTTPQPPCPIETTTTANPCPFAVKVDDTVQPEPIPCPPIEVCSEATVTCPEPIVDCPAPIVDCPSPVITCSTPHIFCPEPVVSCPPPTVTCQEAEVICFPPEWGCSEPIVTCPPPKITCEAPTIVCGAPEISCPPCNKPCITPPPPTTTTTTTTTTTPPCATDPPTTTTTKPPCVTDPPTTTTTTKPPCVTDPPTTTPCDFVKNRRKRSLDDIWNRQEIIGCVSISKDMNYQWVLENCGEERYFICES